MYRIDLALWFILVRADRSVLLTAGVPRASATWPRGLFFAACRAW